MALVPTLLRTRLQNPALQQAGFLFGIDSLTNLIDYAFHIYLGRVLVPGDFAIVQTVNAILLIVVAAFGVMQPVVARFVTESEIEGGTSLISASSKGGFQYYLRYSALAGLALTAVAWSGRHVIAAWLNVPSMAVGLSVGMLFLSLVRPVVTGVLQGLRRFVPYGLTRLTFSIGRFVLAATLIGLGAGALGAIASIPAGWILGLVVGLAFLGLSIWQREPPPPAHVLRAGVQLSISAFIAYAAYMSLLNSDLVWVNRAFAAETSGAYATAVLLRRVLLLLPGAVIVVMFPNAIGRLARRQLPDSLLVQTIVVIVLPTAILTAVYALFGRPLIEITFGRLYLAAAPYMGLMGAAMIGYGVTAIWLNFYLATRPIPFVILLAVTAALQHLLLAAFHQTLAQVTAVFALTGWALAIGGTLLYLLWFRPALKRDWRLEVNSTL